MTKITLRDLTPNLLNPIAYARQALSPVTTHLASSLRGKLFFLFSAAYGMAGRAATLPLVQRQYRDSDHSFTPDSELHHSLFFPRTPAEPTQAPPLGYRIPSDPLLVYTDASFWVAKKRSARGGRRGGVWGR